MRSRWLVISVAHAFCASAAFGQWTAPTGVLVRPQPAAGRSALTVPQSRSAEESLAPQDWDHSLWRELDNGAAIGMGVGAVIGTLVAVRECRDGRCSFFALPVIVLDASAGALGGGIIGAVVAYTIHRRRHVARSSAVKRLPAALPIASSALTRKDPWEQ